MDRILWLLLVATLRVSFTTANYYQGKGKQHVFIITHFITLYQNDFAAGSKYTNHICKLCNKHG